MKESGVEHHRLALDLGEWTVTLHSGEQIELRAHAYVEDETNVVFSVLMDGDPAYYVFRIPRSRVATIVGGECDSRHFAGTRSIGWTVRRAGFLARAPGGSSRVERSGTWTIRRSGIMAGRFRGSSGVEASSGADYVTLESL